VPCSDPNWSDMHRLADVPEGLRNEIEHFFAIYKEPEGRTVTIHGWEDAEVAAQVLDESRRRYAER
jgi:inorganic pyrophosphatase